MEAVREQQPNLGNSWVWTHETSAHQRHYCTKLLVHQSRELHQTQADVVKETRPLTCITVVRVCEPPSTGLLMQAIEGALKQAK